MISIQQLLRQLSSDEWSKIELVLKDFETAWQRGARPDIAAHLEREPSHRDLLLVELIHLDLEHRLKAGEPICVETYLKAYPELDRISGAIVDLATAEFNLRRRREIKVAPEEYLARFPALADSLAARLNKTPDHARLITAAGEALTDRLNEYAQPAVVGKAFGEFQLLSELGRGGMGVVYKAHQENLHRLVAVKVILSGIHARADELARFQAEAVMLARVQHPNIVKIFEVGNVSGTPFFAMELIEGPSLDQTLTGAPMDARRAAHLVLALARGVAAAHQVGIIHRDLKPANVLLGKAEALPEPKVTDFGLARRLELTGQTESAAVLGTPSYMAPEQAAGQTRSAGPAADIYSLGAILYECLTGRPPFRAISALATLDQVRNVDPVPLRQLQPSIPLDLETICLKCLQKNPARRFTSANALADDLQRFLNGEAISARRESIAERAVRWMKRRPVATVLLGVGALASLVFLTMSILLFQSNQDLSKALDTARAEEVRSFDLLYAADIRLAHQFWKRGDVASVKPLLERHLPRADHPDRRGFEWYYLDRLVSSSEPFTLRAEEGEALCVDFTTDGTLVSGHQSGAVLLWNTDKRMIRTRIAAHVGPVYWLKALDDGKTIATSGEDKTVRLWDLATGVERAKITKKDDAVRQLLLSPNGKWLAVARNDDTVQICDAHDDKVHYHLRLEQDFPQPTAPWVITFSADSEVLGFARGMMAHVHSVRSGKRIRHHNFWNMIYGLAFRLKRNTFLAALHEGRVRDFYYEGPEVAEYHSHQGAVRHIAVGRTVPIVATAADDFVVRVFRDRYRIPFCKFCGHTADITALAFAPDDEVVASASRDGSIKLWPLNFKQDHQPLDTWDSAGPVALSGDGQTLGVACKDNRIRWLDMKSASVTGAIREDFGVGLWRAAMASGGDTFALGGCYGFKAWKFGASKELYVELTPTSEVTCLAVSPNGRSIAAALHNGDLILVDLTTKTRRVLKPDLQHIGDLRFSSDGKSLFLGVERSPSLRILDVASGAERPTQYKGKRIFKLVVPRNDRFIALVCGPQDGNGPYDLTVWDPIKQAEVATLASNERTFFAMAFSPDGTLLAVASATSFRIWDVRSKRTRYLPRNPLEIFDDLAFATDGKTLVTSSHEAGTVKLWNTDTWNYREPMGRTWEAIHALAFAADGTLVVGGNSWQGSIQKEDWIPLFNKGILTHYRFGSGGLSFWDSDTASPKPDISPTFFSDLSCFALSSDRKTLLSAGAGGSIWPRDLHAKTDHPPLFVTDQDQKYWEFSRSMPLPFHPHWSKPPRAVTLSPDMQWFATISDPNLVQIWDYAAKKVRQRLDGHVDARCLAFTPDGTQLAVGDGGAIQFWDVATGQKTERLQIGRDNLTCLAFSASGAWLAVGANDRQLQLWKLDGLNLVKHGDLLGHNAGITAVAFTADGKTLASASQDHAVRLWHTATAQPLLTLEGQAERQTCLAWSPDGRTLAGGSSPDPPARGAVVLWHARR